MDFITSLIVFFHDKPEVFGEFPLFENAASDPLREGFHRFVEQPVSQETVGTHQHDAERFTGKTAPVF